MFTFNNNILNGTDLSQVVRDGYALEYYIKNTDPTLRVDIKFESYISRSPWETRTFFSQYSAENSNHLGEWEHVVIPLNDFEDWTDHSVNYWSMLDYQPRFGQNSWPGPERNVEISEKCVSLRQISKKH